MNKEDLMTFEQEIADLFEAKRIKRTYLKILCMGCGKSIWKYGKTGLCSSCWKVGHCRSLDSILKQKVTYKSRYPQPPGGFIKGQHASLSTEFQIGHEQSLNKVYLTGINHPQYIDGRTSLRHKLLYLPEYKMWRRQVFILDNWSCRQCGTVGGDLEVHHIIPIIKLLRKYRINTVEGARGCRVLWDYSNGQTLCKPCHDKTITHGRTRNGQGRFNKIRI